ncbi:Trk system potassium uptake protein trkG [Candidatus Ornithobacterium hominis]|nr:Trk system potassium uptake protein trkG [Candidatus Ornithobacterium hominis]
MPFFKKINFPIIFRMLGILLIVNALFMLSCVPVNLYYNEASFKGMLSAALITGLLGCATFFTFKNAKKDIGKREGYLIVSLGWVTMALFGTLPYLLSAEFLSTQVLEINTINLTNAFFEVMSGYSTTGASTLNDIEIMPKGLLLWRSMTHWLGGMGIIVLTLAILPLLGIGGMQLFIAEAPGITADKIHPRITDTAKRLWLLYVILTCLQIVLLFAAGMNLFDAVNHSFSTIASGGFSTKNASIAYWNHLPLIQYIICVFMFFSGMNFILIYFLFKRKFKKIFSDAEFLHYSGIVIILTIISTLIVHYYTDLELTSVVHPGVNIDEYGNKIFGWEPSFRHSLFTILSIITTTGFVSADFTQWAPFLTAVYFTLMFVGGSAGSTSGGVKIIRHIILIKNSWYEFKRLVHPHAIIPVRLGGKTLDKKVIFHVMAFFIAYIVIFMAATIILTFIDFTDENISNEFFSSMGVAASTLGNVGPGLGKYSPVNNFSEMSAIGKWFCSFLMLIGRLEIFTILILFTPFFWKK